MVRRQSVVFFLAGAVTASWLSACNGCSDPVSAVKDKKGTQHNDTDVVLRSLHYIGPSPVTLIRSTSTSLRFSLTETESGAPVTGEAIAIVAEGTSASADVSVMPTNAAGIVDIPLTASAELGTTTLIARAADGDGATLEARVAIDVIEDPVAGLAIHVDAQTRIAVGQAAVRVFAGEAVPSCDELAGLDATSWPLGFFDAPVVAPIPTDVVVDAIDAGARVTVVGAGLNLRGVTIAHGCVEVAPLAGGDVTDVDLTLVQDPTSVDGDYDVLMHMALGDALPSPYDSTLDMVTALLADPAGYALYYALREVDRSIGTTFVTRDGEEMAYRDVEADPSNYPTWQWGQGQLDAMLIEQLGQNYIDMTNIGAGLRDVVTDFEIGGRFSITTVDGETFAVNEQWQDVVLYWPLPCTSPTGAVDMACARRPLRLEDDNLAPVIASYGADVAFAPMGDVTERFAVATDHHGLTLRYGALLLAILNQVVFESLPGDIAANNLGDVLVNVVGCNNVAVSLTDDPFVQQLVESVCVDALWAAAAQVEEQLLALEVGATNPELGQAGLAAQGNFVLVDRDQDLVTEELSGYAYDIHWYNPQDPQATSDLQAPITGEGRRAWPVCVHDAGCGTGETCQVRPSYLETADVEQGCARNIGNVAGGLPCSSDAQCQAGLCLPVGAAGAMACVQTCAADADCGAGSCQADGGLVNLDSTLAGLSDVSFAACNMP